LFYNGIKMKTRAQTFLQKVGFKDEDLKTPRHDEIILSLMDKDKMLEVITSCYPELEEGSCWSKKVNLLHSFTHTNYPTYSIWGDLFEVDPSTNSLKVKIKVEDLVKGYERNKEKIIGELERIKQDFEDFKKLEIELFIEGEKPIVKGVGTYKTIIGYVDFLVTLTHPVTKYFSSVQPTSNIIRSEQHTTKFFIEVKPKITSFGETLRQMKTYIEYTNAKPIIVADTTQEIKEAFEKEGIKLYLLNNTE